MKIEFREFKEFERGILYKQLLDAYSFNTYCKKYWERDWQEYDTYFFDHLKYTNSCGFILVLDGVPIGHISWDPRKRPNYIEIGHNCILTQYKGKGYGHILLKEAIQRIKSQYSDLKKIIVTTSANFIPAQRNYESVGFHFIRERKNDETPLAGNYMDYEMIL